MPLPDPAARKRSPRLELSGKSGCGFAAVVFLPPAFLADRAEAEPFAVLLAESASGDGVRGGFFFVLLFGTARRDGAEAGAVCIVHQFDRTKVRYHRPILAPKSTHNLWMV